MRLVVQKVSQAAVTSVVEGRPAETAEIARGLCVLVGFEKDDTSADCQAMSKQLLKLRLFNSGDDAPKASRYSENLTQVGADLLLVSQFTLNATLKSGRPSFHRAMGSEPGAALFEEFITLCRDGLRDTGGAVRTGIFGSWMQVHLVNDGPFTICLTCKDGKCDTW